jgi:hypothetical protein
MVEQLDLLYSQIYDKETLLDVFLKGENVCIQIKQIYDVYYEKLAKMQNYELEKNECDLLSMRSAYNLLNNLNDILSLIKELSDNYDLLDKSKIYHINEQIHSIVKEIEEELTEIFETIYQNINSHYIFDALLFTNQVETKEEKLLRIIFGEEKKEKTKSLIKAQNRLSNSIIYRD